MYCALTLDLQHANELPGKPGTDKPTATRKNRRATGGRTRACHFLATAGRLRVYGKVSISPAFLAGHRRQQAVCCMRVHALITGVLVQLSEQSPYTADRPTALISRKNVGPFDCTATYFCVLV